jgi:hypothetical protein
VEVEHIPVLVVLSETFFRTPVRLIRGVDIDDFSTALTNVFEIIAIVRRFAFCVGVANVFVSFVRHVVRSSGCRLFVFEYPPCEAEKVNFVVVTEGLYKCTSGYPGKTKDTSLYDSTDTR